MTANLFFLPKDRWPGDVCVLAGAEHHHLSRVVRLGRGSEVWVFDEDGARGRARIESVGPETTRLRILERTAAAAVGPEIILAQALLKAKAMDEVVERAAEWGAAAVLPVAAERSVVKTGDGGGRKAERWRQIALAAAKQCKSGRPPRIDPPRPLAAFLAEPRAGAKIVLSEHGGTPLGQAAAGAEAARTEGRESWTLLVGPEGGWAPAEEERIAAAGFVPASLGRRILRAETAALSALAILTHARES